MLTHIRISNFAIIDELELEFSSGFSVLTGETGAGKSIIVDALGLALGDRADSQVVRQGENRAEVALTFDICNLPNAQQWLKNQDLELESNECIVRRVITKEGRSRAYINGSNTPLQQLRSLGNLLVEIHGQHEHQTLLSRDTQLHLLDSFSNTCSLVEQLTKVSKQWHKQHQALLETKASLHEKQTRSEYLQFQLNELSAIDIQPNEIPQLQEEHQRLTHAEMLLSTTERCLQAFDESDHSVINILHQHLNELEKLCHIDNSLKEGYELLESAALQVNEANKTLRHYLDRVELDPEKLQLVEQRISAIHDLSRKHNVAPEELLSLQNELQQELDKLAFSDEHIAAFERELADLEQSYHTLASKLSKGRKQGAKKLAKAIERVIHQLGLPNGHFEISLQAITDKLLPSKGLERVDFLVSTNPGQAPAQLNKVASGGELSRISLAIQVIAANKNENMTFVFDEVDTGIGGGVAETVGQQLASLGLNHQVFCVTHLAQVAALGHRHFNVSKTTDGKTTTTQISPLDDNQRIEEIARMLGGKKITQQTRGHATEMLRHAQQTEDNNKKTRKRA